MDRIRPDLFRLASGGFAAPHVVMGDVPTLVDAGMPGRGPAIERELRAAGMRIERIVLTHGDPDHAGGSDHLRQALGAEVCAALAERPLLDRSGWPMLPPVRRLLMRSMYRRTPPPTIDRWIAGSEILGGLVALATPGHTPGHLVLSWEGWLLVGDAFITGDRFRESPWPFTIDRDVARASIERLLEHEPAGASSSHGCPAQDATGRLQALVDRWR